MSGAEERRTRQGGDSRASAIFLTGIAKSFGRAPVMRGLDLEVPDRSVVVILGESGSGKTTLLRIIAGFERPDKGTVALDGHVVDSEHIFLPPEKRRIGYVAQEGNLFPHLTVAGNVGFGLGRMGRARDSRPRETVAELLKVVGLPDLGGRYPHQLSGGQQQRVALARALASNPRVVLLDEPFSSLDPGLRASVRFDVMRILREHDATTVLVTHDQSEALSIADKVGVIVEGTIRQFAAPEDLYSHPADETTARFLGEANLVSGTASSGAVYTTFGKLALGNGSDPLDGPVTVLIRPEQVSLRSPGERAPGEVGLTGRVVHREYYGHDSVVLVDIGGEDPLRVRCSGRIALEIGDAVEVTAIGDVVAWPSVIHAGDPGAA